ncbi:MAG: hypothetical protein EBU88_19520, partial [Acidobacteria bacterium]|nr:hypothetical protein [Acidobacteriota bacterium]
LLCLLIIAAIFLIPGRFFTDRDRPVPPPVAAPAAGSFEEAAQIEVTVSELASFLQTRDRTDLTDFPVEALGFYLREQYNQTIRILRYEQYEDSRQASGYRVWFVRADPIKK